jgi:hypothetical protein
MDAPKDCPLCRLVNPTDARRCDCGYDFAARRHVGSLFSPSRPVAIGAGSALLLGAALVTFGAIVGAAVGVPVQTWLAGPGMERCGLWILPVAAEGLISGALAGILAGVAVASVIVWLLNRRRAPGADGVEAGCSASRAPSGAG